MPARTTAPPMEVMATAIPKAFDQAQSSMATHQKNFIALHKVHAEVATITEEVHSGMKLVGERAFEDGFIEMINRVLVIKKGTTVADRIVKFVGGYIKFLNAKVAEERAKQEEDEDEQEETTASRFTARLLKHFLKGFEAKDKNVRYRVVHFAAEMMSHLGEVEEATYELLRAALMERVRDKEPTVRVQAVIALSKLCGTENPDDIEEGEPTALEVLEGILAYDPTADVRRAVLLNMPVSPTTLTALLARTRDIDTTVRKLTYSVLENNITIPGTEDAVGVTHPRALTIAQRELIVRNGLGDREPAVRAAAGKLVSAWVDAISAHKGSVLEDLIAFLQTFDLAESQLAEDALLSVFVTRPEYFDGLEFEDAFWTELTPERAFLVRVFVDYCVTNKDNTRLENVLPVVTALAFRIQSAYNDLEEQLEADEQDRMLRGADEEDQDASKEEERMGREFVISEMLKLAVNLDYADEIGRRKMFQLIRVMVAQESLPENLVARCLDVLRVLSPNERELIRIVVEVVHELRDPAETEEDAENLREDPEITADDGETTFGETPRPGRIARPLAEPKRPEDMSPEEQARADLIDVRCLDLCIGMLERVNGTFEENSTLEGILGELVVPAVKRKEVVLREKGLVTLGLCCLIARNMARNSLQLFLSQVQTAPENLKVRVLQVVFDVLMVHDADFLAKDSPQAERMVEFLLNVLSQEDSDRVQALIAMGFAKLMLSGMITDERVLTSLVLVYLSPDTVDNQELRQCLSYFFPVYCYSSPANQRRMQGIFLPIFDQLSGVYKELEDDHEMVSPAQVSGMFVDWTDPQKLIELPGLVVDEDIHVDMAADIVKAMFNQDMEKDDKKVLCQVLTKLYIPPEMDDDKIRRLKLLMQTLLARRPIRDTAANNAFAKFDKSISQKFEKQLEAFNEDEFRELESLKDLFEFLDDIMPEEDEEDEAPKKRGRKRRSDSVVTSTTSSTAGDDDAPVTPSRKKGNAACRSLTKRTKMTTMMMSFAGRRRRLLHPRGRCHGELLRKLLT
ncbi:ARM repeat-containing protein [Dentipellis sp. KUC8613]|nr:ARM repeat-containing protein [Dentipellis sp. KUC8613]